MTQQGRQHSISPVKGHATLKHMRDMERPRDAIFNSYADAAAAHGHRHPTVAAKNELLDYLGRKQEHLVRVVAAIQRRLARVAKAANELLDEQAKNQPQDMVDAPLFKHSDLSHTTSTFSFENAPPIDIEEDYAIVQIMIRIFWTRLMLVPIEDHSLHHGTTWLELYAWFSIKGGFAVVQPEARKHLRLKFAQDFAQLRLRSKALFKYACSDSANLTIPMRHKNDDFIHPLREFGVIGKLSMLPFRLALNESGARLLHDACCALGGNLRGKQLPERLPVAPFKPPIFST